MSLIIHGVPLSQPFRSIVWPCLIKGLSFQIAIAVPGDKGKYGTRRPEYLSKFPFGTIPSIEDAYNGTKVYLSEAPAILAYLSSKHGWGDIYPTSEEAIAKAKLDEYLHWHHSNMRSVTRGYFFPYMFPQAQLTPDIIQLRQREARHALKVLDQSYLASKQGPFLLGTLKPTAADFIAYEEIVQLEYGHMFSVLEAYSNIQEWLKKMKSLPFHDQVHVANKELGDITQESPPLLERAAPLTKVFLEAITDAQQEDMSKL